MQEVTTIMKQLIALLTLVSIFFFSHLSQARENTAALPPEITFTEGYPLTSVSRISREIAKARGDIHENNLNDAAEALNRASVGIKFIRESSPAARVRDYVWVARRHLPFEDTEKIMKDFVAIHAALKDMERTRFVQNAEEYIDRATISLEKKDRDKAKTELELADKALLYSELNPPLSITEDFITSAQGFLKQGLPEKADLDLKNAEDQLQFMVTDLYSPLPQARKSIWSSSRHFADREYSTAKKDLERAEVFLKKAMRSGDVKTRQQAGKLLRDLTVLKDRVEKGGKTGEAHIKSLWERTRALAERDAEYMTLAAGKIETIGGVKKDIINARMHILNAKAYQLTEGNVRRARREMEEAEKYLDNAMAKADEDTRRQLLEINTEVRRLGSESDKKEQAVRNLYMDIDNRLYHLVYNK